MKTQLTILALLGSMAFQANAFAQTSGQPFSSLFESNGSVAMETGPTAQFRFSSGFHTPLTRSTDGTHLDNWVELPAWRDGYTVCEAGFQFRAPIASTLPLSFGIASGNYSLSFEGNYGYTAGWNCEPPVVLKLANVSVGIYETHEDAYLGFIDSSTKISEQTVDIYISCLAGCYPPQVTEEMVSDIFGGHASFLNVR